MLPTTVLSLLAYCPLVSNLALLGTVDANLGRIHETAVSCKMISCMCPGCTIALSPIQFLKPWSRSACLPSQHRPRGQMIPRGRCWTAIPRPLEASLEAGLEASSVSNNTTRAMCDRDPEAPRGWPRGLIRIK